MAATVVISETNGASPGVVTMGVSDSDMGNQDSPTVDPVAFPITPGNNAFEKWQRFEITTMGGSSKIDNFRVWVSSGTLATNTSLKTNLQTTTPPTLATYATPVNTASTVAGQVMPTAEPGTANLGGSLTAVGYSNYIVMQIQTAAAATAGATVTLSYKYDETA